MTRFPITYKEVTVTISAPESNKELSGSISSIIVGRNGISCYDHTMRHPNFGLIKEESFEEAICLLNQLNH